MYSQSFVGIGAQDITFKTLINGIISGNYSGQYRNVIRMKGLRDLANKDPERPLTFAPFFLGAQYAKDPWDSAGATFKSTLNTVCFTTVFFIVSII